MNVRVAWLLKNFPRALYAQRAEIAPQNQASEKVMGKKRNSRFRILSEFEGGRACVSRKPPRCNREATTAAALDQTITRTNARTVDACAAFRRISAPATRTCAHSLRGEALFYPVLGVHVALHIADFARARALLFRTASPFRRYRLRSTKRSLIARDSYNVLIREPACKLVGSVDMPQKIKKLR